VRELVLEGGRRSSSRAGTTPTDARSGTRACCAAARALPAVNSTGSRARDSRTSPRSGRRRWPEIPRRLKAAGSVPVPGGGAEILVDRVRKVIAPLKATTEDGSAYRARRPPGLRSSATMMFGHVETKAERVEHLARLRELQARPAVHGVLIAGRSRAPPKPRAQGCRTGRARTSTCDARDRAALPRQRHHVSRPG